MRQILLNEMDCKLDKAKGVLAAKGNEVRRFRDGQSAAFAMPGINTANWLNKNITNYQTLGEAVEKVAYTIKFEAQHFGILRLDDHISDLIASVDGTNAEMAIKKFN